MSHPEGMRRALPLLLVLAACTVDEPVAQGPAPEPTNEAEPSAPAEPAPATPAPVPTKLPPGTTDVNDLSAALQRLSRLMHDVRDAVEKAGQAAEGDECAKARFIFLASNDAMRASLEAEPLPGDRTPPTWDVPDAPRFAELCHQLPPEVQHCLRLDARGQERERCQPIMRDLPEAQQALVDELSKSFTPPAQ
ncbi:MAG: hypothetical protein CMN30_03285 [Sandaracinus sp.]|nr:hypothetical protein [Sandaracinus sp.]|tara:strand:- start:93 stop:671 length:579 start_codon:yes stop_codon:yes gene_type:complete